MVFRVVTWIIAVIIGAVRALCPRCAKTPPMLDPCSPDGQGDRSNCRVPMHRTAQILTQSKNSDNAVFHAENATLLSKSAVFALRMHASRVWGGACRVVTGSLTY